MTTGRGAPRTLAIANRRGLHARAAAKFVKTAALYDAQVQVAKDGMQVSGQSIMGLMMLAAGIGSTIEVSVEGPEAEAALDAIAALVEAKFEED